MEKHILLLHRWVQDSQHSTVTALRDVMWATGNNEWSGGLMLRWSRALVVSCSDTGGCAFESLEKQITLTSRRYVILDAQRPQPGLPSGKDWPLLSKL